MVKLAQRNRRVKQRDFAVDVGTSNTVVYLRGHGVVLDEPSVIAVDRHSGRRLGAGSEAKQIAGLDPRANLVHPLVAGAITDVEGCEAMLRSFMARALPGRRAQRHRSVICVPFSMTDLEERTVREAAELAGACYAVVVEKAMAAAIGAGLPVNDPSGSMIVDVGGGTTDVAVVALGSIVAGRSLPTGGNEMDAAVVGHLSRRFDLVLQPRSAEAVKIKMGSAYPLIPELHGEVWGRDLETGIRRSIITSTAEIRQAIAGPVAAITEAVTATIDELSPSRWAEVKGRGIVLCGGGSLLAGLAERLQAETGAAVRVAANPIHCVAIGAGRYLDAYADNVIEHLVPAS